MFRVQLRVKELLVPIFDRYFADLLQHFAVILEILGLSLIWWNLKIHQADRGSAFRHVIAGVAGSPPDRSSRIIRGFKIAAVGVGMEIYQLLTIYFG